MTYPTKLRKRFGARRGQSMVEMALFAPFMIFTMLMAFQFAVIARASLALDQLSSAVAQYAAHNPRTAPSAIATYAQSIAPPTLLSNSGADLSVTVSPNTSPRTSQTNVTVSISYKLSSKMVLPNPFFGISLPTSLTDATTELTQQ
jgi:Flp pilus assembly protein TadG